VSQHKEGSPYIDPKRPYGNSDILKDIHKILGTVPILVKHNDKYFSEEQDAYAEKIDGETGQALQVILRAGSFIPGVYAASEYCEDWQLVHTEDTQP
jgi:hypothetical protein